MSSSSYNYFFMTVIFHFFLFAADNLLKYWLSSWYTTALKRNGIYIQLFILRWFTTVFNRSIQKFGTWRSKCQKTWYTLGMWISLISLPLAFFFVLQSTFVLLVNVLWNDTKSAEGPTPFLKPAIPGFNLPFSDMGYYILSLLVCSIFHELGHALAAVREGLHVAGVGIFIVFLIPAAFVRIEGIENLSITKQLRVFCAGVWHNIVLAISAALILFFLPWLCYPFYEYGNGIQVVYIHQNSPLQEEGGLKVGDIITSINKCPVLSEVTWIKCIHQIVKTPIPGYCIPSEFIHENDESVRVKQLHNVVECCSNNTLSGICFEYLEETDNPLELPQYTCLKVRAVIHQSKGTCYSPKDCINLHCFRPSLTNGTKLMEIERRGYNEVLFLGYPLEVLYGIHISEYIESNLSVIIPIVIIKFCNFIIMFSGALAAINLVPCFHFDGQHITRILIDTSLAKSVRLNSIRLAVSISITILGTSILVLYTILIFFSVFLK